ncbi:MAG TPA: pyridoxamine 5'-phosphate oxidase [Pseudonocardia sp.]|jgi:pyridoxamine 5'-phosphate oxidase|uniref:pyridoxamine 5'-phosphate oxidase n=1 Tax=Pseudonocardia sp. TaxID=60912 RepID=UPI002B4B59FB|nr:pyridoxamine 5'-phosphate oxidase [Pseudonocardia sp.]HLU57935.1 pyridoxamine 5'-phosphate oxidase [Pseudonocardia sp.]
MAKQLATMRVDYARTDELDVGDLAATWHEQLTRWMDEAITDGVVEPNAMVLATTDEDGKPSSRTVLCKGIDARGIVFFTNYTSAKSHQLRATRYASATFPWYAQHRQVHVRGHVELVTPEENAAYWATRPRGAQLGAWASAQSTEVRDRRVLDDALATITQRFAHEEKVPPPPHWGGWRILPEQVEFWQGRQDRMHDRLRYEHDPHSRAWRIRRLAP